MLSIYNVFFTNFFTFHYNYWEFSPISFNAALSKVTNLLFCIAYEILFLLWCAIFKKLIVTNFVNIYYFMTPRSNMRIVYGSWYLSQSILLKRFYILKIDYFVYKNIPHFSISWKGIIFNTNFIETQTAIYKIIYTPSSWLFWAE